MRGMLHAEAVIFLTGKEQFLRNLRRFFAKGAKSKKRNEFFEV